jgi:CheY-like chemotaxis protein
MDNTEGGERQICVGLSKRVLLVDDDEHVLFVWSNALARLGFACCVETARNGREALKKFRTGEYDLVVTDLRMPYMDGCQLTEAIRRIDATVPIVWVTGFRYPGTDLHIRQLAVYTCLDKPVTTTRIRQIVGQALGLAEPPASAGPQSTS